MAKKLSEFSVVWNSIVLTVFVVSNYLHGCSLSSIFSCFIPIFLIVCVWNTVLKQLSNKLFKSVLYKAFFFSVFHLHLQPIIIHSVYATWLLMLLCVVYMPYRKLKGILFTCLLRVYNFRCLTLFRDHIITQTPTKRNWRRMLVSIMSQVVGFQAEQVR